MSMIVTNGVLHRVPTNGEPEAGCSSQSASALEV